jgi:hypothetical protein
VSVPARPEPHPTDQKPIAGVLRFIGRHTLEIYAIQLAGSELLARSRTLTRDRIVAKARADDLKIKVPCNITIEPE